MNIFGSIMVISLTRLLHDGSRRVFQSIVSTVSENMFMSARENGLLARKTEFCEIQKYVVYNQNMKTYNDDRVESQR